MSRNSKRRRATKIAGEATRLIENSIATFNAIQWILKGKLKYIFILKKWEKVLVTVILDCNYISIILSAYKNMIHNI